MRFSFLLFLDTLSKLLKNALTKNARQLTKTFIPNMPSLYAQYNYTINANEVIVSDVDGNIVLLRRSKS